MDITQNPLKWDDLTIRRYPLRKLHKVKNPPIRGFDTETIHGYCNLLMDDAGRYYQGRDLDTILEFLTHRNYRGCHNFFYNLRFDAQAVLKYMPKSNLKELYNTTKTDYLDTRVKYIPEKLLSLTRSKNVVKFYDLAQFYEMSLDKASRLYLGEHKKNEGLDVEMLGESPQYWEQHYDEIIEYCAHDAVLCRRLGYYLHNKLYEALEFRPQSYTSKAGLSKQYFRLSCDIPDIQKIPIPVMSMYLAAYAGGRFEVSRKGFIPKCYGIDIVSAYPYAVTRLPDVTRGEWKRTDRMHEDALEGVYLAEVFVPYMQHGPIMFREKSGLKHYPIGAYWAYLTKEEIEVYQEDVKIRVKTGYEYYDKDPVYPFKEAILNLFDLKKSTDKSDYKYDLYKKMMNSFYGSQYEKFKQDYKILTGKLFNPVYATIITAYCRLIMWQIIREYQDYIIACATDGIVMDKKPRIAWSKDLGGWDRDKEGDVTIIRSGLYQIADTTKSRGIKRMTELKTPYGTFADIFEYMRDQPQLTEYTINTVRPLSLGECLAHTKKRDVEDINVFTITDYTLNINRDYKRIWEGEFKNGGDLLEREIASKPLIKGG